MKNSSTELYRVTKERLNGTSTDLTSFLFHDGGNVHVFSYEKDGMRRHTLIDAGDLRYENQILSIFTENDVNPANIDRIIITHRHPDHCGLADLLAKKSEAKILVHANFRSFIEEELKPEEKMWLGNFSPSRLKRCNIEYLSQRTKGDVLSLNGLDFPSLTEPIKIGDAGKLMILACPQSIPTHSPDQIIALYSTNGYPHTKEKKHDNWQLKDDIVFSGDLWLMTGPIHNWSARHLLLRLKFGLRHLKGLLSGGSMPLMDPRLQDSEAKEALKKGFHIVRVKPGHGEEFLGSSIIPDSLLADRDLLLKLGHPLNANKALLRRKDLAPRVAAMKEQAYTSFIKEVASWVEQGYTTGEVLALLVRIYKEQSGGGTLAAEDRKQRRERLKATLTRVSDDKAESGELRQLAEATMAKLKEVL